MGIVQQKNKSLLSELALTYSEHLVFNAKIWMNSKPEVIMQIMSFIKKIVVEDLQGHKSEKILELILYCIETIINNSQPTAPSSSSSSASQSQPSSAGGPPTLDWMTQVKILSELVIRLADNVNPISSLMDILLHYIYIADVSQIYKQQKWPEKTYIMLKIILEIFSRFQDSLYKEMIQEMKLTKECGFFNVILSIIQQLISILTSLRNSDKESGAESSGLHSSKKKLEPYFAAFISSTNNKLGTAVISSILPSVSSSSFGRVSCFMPWLHSIASLSLLSSQASASSTGAPQSDIIDGIFAGALYLLLTIDWSVLQDAFSVQLPSNTDNSTAPASGTTPRSSSHSTKIAESPKKKPNISSSTPAHQAATTAANELSPTFNKKKASVIELIMNASEKQKSLYIISVMFSLLSDDHTVFIGPMTVASFLCLTFDSKSPFADKKSGPLIKNRLFLEALLSHFQ